MKQGAAEPIAALNRVRIDESDEPLVDIRLFCPGVEVIEKVCPFLRHTVARMLNDAAGSLPDGYRFRIGTALRTISMQRRGWDTYFERIKAEHPAWPLSAARRATNRYYAPYDQPAPPGHCTGGAVDVVLLGSDGEPADVISPTEGWEAAYTWSDRISAEARHNRMILVKAMLDAGFSNCREEYWHYSWGDSAWAVRTGASTCPYGFIDPPVSVEAGFEGARIAGITPIGELSWRCHAESINSSPALCFGVFWALGRIVELELHPDLPKCLFSSEDRETWHPYDHQPNGAPNRIIVSPTADRLYLSSHDPSQQSPD